MTEQKDTLSRERTALEQYKDKILELTKTNSVSLDNDNIVAIRIMYYAQVLVELLAQSREEISQLKQKLELEPGSSSSTVDYTSSEHLPNNVAMSSIEYDSLSSVPPAFSQEQIKIMFAGYNDRM